MGGVIDFDKPVDPSTLEDKAVLITGGASGIGALIARAFAGHGALVTIADINERQGRSFVEELATDGKRINFIKTDVTDWTSQVEAFKSAIRFAGHNCIDIVVAAAGLSGAEFTSPQDGPASLDRDPPLPPLAGPTFDVNVKAVYFTTKLAQYYFALLRISKVPYRKSLTLISSLAGYLEIKAADYTATKWAVRGIFRSTRCAMEDLGYRVNLIAPWVMDTPMSKGLAEICRQHGIPVGNAEDVAQAVVRCAADESICGRAIAVGAKETFDLRDDIEGLNAGFVMKGYLEDEAKDFMVLNGQRP